MRTVKIISIGNSAAVILPKAVLAKLRVRKGDVLRVTETRNGIELTPNDAQYAQQMSVAAQIMRGNRHALKKLAR